MRHYILDTSDMFVIIFLMVITPMCLWSAVSEEKKKAKSEYIVETCRKRCPYTLEYRVIIRDHLDRNLGYDFECGCRIQ